MWPPIKGGVVTGQFWERRRWRDGSRVSGTSVGLPVLRFPSLFHLFSFSYFFLISVKEMAAETVEHWSFASPLFFSLLKFASLFLLFFIRVGSKPADYWTWSRNAVQWKTRPKGIEEPQNQNGSGKTKSTFVDLQFLSLSSHVLNGWL